MKINDFKKRNWVVLGANAQLLYADTFAEPVARDYYKKFGIPNEVPGIGKGIFVEWLYDEAQIVALSEKLIPELRKDPWQYYDDWSSQAVTYHRFHEKTLAKDFSSLSREALDKLARDYVKVFRDQFTPSNILESLSYYFQHHFPRMLKESGLSEEQSIILMHQYGCSKYPSYIKECLREYRAAKTEREIEKILEKYSYLPNDYIGPKVLTKTYLSELLQEKSHDNSHVPARGTKIPNQARELLELFQMVATLQDVRKASSLRMVDGVHALAQEYAKRFQIPLTKFWYVLWDEIFSNTVDPAKLTERAQAYVVFWGKETTSLIEGKKAHDFTEEIHRIVFKKDEGSQEIKGICASVGKVTGRAVVVLHPDEFHKVKKGDVLFTMMTRPEFLPVMNLAAAFVTDEGGITSHAAIVAREMKKPCIIATKNGTKIIKDDDVVEVNANDGVVNILKRVV